MFIAERYNHEEHFEDYTSFNYERVQEIDMKTYKLTRREIKDINKEAIDGMLKELERLLKIRSSEHDQIIHSEQSKAL